MPCSRLFRYTMVTCGPIMLVGAAFVGLRLVPLSFRQGIAPATLWPLWAAALAAVFESALLLGTPLGFALGLSGTSGVSMGESAVGPGTTGHKMRRWLPFLVFWLAVTAGIGTYANLRFAAPGRVARGVVKSARDDCESGTGDRVVAVPLIGARWVCSPPRPSRLVGELSRNHFVARYSVREIELSEDLASVDLSDLELFAPAARGRPAIRLAAQQARLRGAWPWARQRRLPGLGRAVYVTCLTSMLGVFAAILAVRRREGSRLRGAVAAVVGGACAWTLLRIVDTHEHWAAGSYAMVPVGAGLAMASVWSLLGCFKPERFLASNAVKWWRSRGKTHRRPG